MLKITRLLQLFFIVGLIWASPFELTEKYVQDFQEGLNKLIDISRKTILVEDNYNPEHFDEDAALKNAEEFDFIVVGGGSSGAVIANRLSEVPEWKVLVLEAGAPESPYAQPPSVTNHLLSTPYNWGYKIEPQEKACLGSDDNRCSINTGRGMGGTSAINRMIYTRGVAKDYDIWADLGNDGWCYKDILPYFKKSEDAHLHKFDRKHHSQGGPLNVEDPQYESAVGKEFLAAGHELGYKTIDYNGEENIGFAIPQLVTKHGRRNSVSRAYLETAKNRKNLVIRPFSQVTQILIAPHTKEATGVKYISKGKLYVATSKKEIILSAGAINSAQILMLSGIGPKEALERLGITSVEDLSVGRNLKDHVAFIGMNFLTNNSVPVEDEKENLVSWLKDGHGRHSHVGIEALAFLQTELSKSLPDHPDIALMLLPHPMNKGHEYVKNEFNIRKELYASIWAHNEDKTGVTVMIILPHPKSTGSVKLHTKDPLNYPIINGNYLTDEEQVDRDTLIAGIKKVVALSETEAAKRLGIHLNDKLILGCSQVEFHSDEYWKCALSHLTVSLSVPSGTCRMAPDNDKDGVVNNKLQVRGIQKLRVADASVIPSTLTAHNEAPEVVIGEKCADLVKQDWK